jgi:hypothetical protein
MTKLLSALAVASLTTLSIALKAKADIFDAKVYCQVEGIRRGQLALRHQPNGEPFAGLNNGNTVQAFGGTPFVNERGVSSVWYEVKVLQGPNSRVNGKKGVVNADYLTCDWYNLNGEFIRREIAPKR